MAFSDINELIVNADAVNPRMLVFSVKSFSFQAFIHVLCIGHNFLPSSQNSKTSYLSLGISLGLSFPSAFGLLIVISLTFGG